MTMLIGSIFTFFRSVCYFLLSHSNNYTNNSIRVTASVRENNLFATYKVKITRYIPANLIRFCSCLPFVYQIFSLIDGNIVAI